MPLQCLWFCAEAAEAAAGTEYPRWKSSVSSQGHPEPYMEIATSLRAGWKHNKQSKIFSEQASQCFTIWTFHFNLATNDFFYSTIAKHQAEELKATYKCKQLFFG